MTDRDDTKYHLLRILAENPNLSQRDVAQKMGISLGKANYCLKGLIDRGWVKANNFRRSDNKAAYMYLLTPKGLQAKAGITLAYLQRKMVEYDSLKQEIADLQKEVEVDGSDGSIGES